MSADAAGGAEQVLSQLDRALVARGHRSLVVAAEGSRVAGTLAAIPLPPAPFDARAQARARAACRAAIGGVLAREKVDLVHLHGVDFAHCLPPPGVPALVTLHLPLGWYDAAALRPARPRTWLHAVSASQRRLGPPGLDLLPDLPNGVDLAALRARHAKRGFVLALGRVCPEKGYHLALDAAREAGLSMLLAGAVYPYPEHEAYMHDAIVPRLDRRRRFLGPVGFRRKRRLLTAARCLVVPSLVPETGSLVAMEALACGTPVVAFGHGALAEMIEPGRTGFLVEDAAGLAAAMRAAAELDPAACRAAARARFDQRATVERYLALYARLAAEG